MLSQQASVAAEFLRRTWWLAVVTVVASPGSKSMFEVSGTGFMSVKYCIYYSSSTPIQHHYTHPESISVLQRGVDKGQAPGKRGRLVSFRA